MSEDIRLNEFNEAKFKMVRIHELQDMINVCSGNLLGYFFINEGKYAMHNGVRNYELKLNLLEQLRIEIVEKLTDKEITKLSELKKRIDEWLEKKPIHKVISQANGRIETIVDDISFKLFKKLLLEYNEQVVIMAAQHGYSGKESRDLKKVIAG